MEDKVKLGSAGDVDLSLSGGKASVALDLAFPGAAITGSVVVTMDAAALIDKLKAAIEKAYPASAPIDEAVFAVLKAAVSQV